MDNFVDWSNFEKVYKIYEKRYDIRFCDISEYDKIVNFINNYWQKGHIFTKSKELLDWQHLDKWNNRYNFVIASDKLPITSLVELEADFNAIPKTMAHTKIPK